MVLWILIIIFLIGVWILLSPLFGVIGECFTKKYNKIFNENEGENNNARTNRNEESRENEHRY